MAGGAVTPEFFPGPVASVTLDSTKDEETEVDSKFPFVELWFDVIPLIGDSDFFTEVYLIAKVEENTKHCKLK